MRSPFQKWIFIVLRLLHNFLLVVIIKFSILFDLIAAFIAWNHLKIDLLLFLIPSQSINWTRSTDLVMEQHLKHTTILLYSWVNLFFCGSMSILCKILGLVLEISMKIAFILPPRLTVNWWWDCHWYTPAFAQSYGQWISEKRCSLVHFDIIP